jgi:hypothetical protein
MPNLLCETRDIRDHLMRAVVLTHLPAMAERDVVLAIEQVRPDTQEFFSQCAADAALSYETGLERLACIWAWAAAVNLADDLADDECAYLENRVGPGVCFLLQNLAGTLGARGSLSAQCSERASLAMVRAAAGQSLEVRARDWTGDTYLAVASMIAGEQYSAYLQMLWHESLFADSAAVCGVDVGTVGLTVTDLESADRRFLGMSEAHRQLVVSHNRRAVARLKQHGSSGVLRFAHFADLKLNAIGLHDISTSGAL